MSLRKITTPSLADGPRTQSRLQGRPGHPDGRLLQRVCGSQMFDALIRTYNSANTIASVLIALRAQEVPPEQIIVVDSGSRDATLDIVQSLGCTVLHYGSGPFNYSRALNIGIAHVIAPACLVLSSHVILRDSGITRRLLKEIRVAEVPAAYINHCSDDHYREVIVADSFNGRNGLWNTCAMYRTETVRDIGFNENIPTAEDQFFAKRLFTHRFRTVAIGSSLTDYKNPNTNLRKYRNEYVAIAYFVHPPSLRFRNIAAVARQALACALRADSTNAFDRAALAVRLLCARVRRPRFRSRYFRGG